MLSLLATVLSVFVLVGMGFFVKREYSRFKQGPFSRKPRHVGGAPRSERSTVKLSRSDLRHVEFALDRLGQSLHH